MPKDAYPGSEMHEGRRRNSDTGPSASCAAPAALPDDRVSNLVVANNALRRLKWRVCLLTTCYTFCGGIFAFPAVAVFVRTRQLVDNDVSLAQTMLVVYSLGWSLKPLYAFAIQKIRRQRDKYTRRLLIALVVLSGSVTFFSANMVATASDVTTFGVYMFLVYGGLAGLESIVDGYICRAVKRLDACNQFHGAKTQSCAWALRFLFTGVCQLAGGHVAKEAGATYTLLAFRYMTLAHILSVFLLVYTESSTGISYPGRPSKGYGWVGMYAPILAFVFFYNFGATIEPIYMYWVMEVGHVNELSLAFIRLARYIGLANGAALYSNVRGLQEMKKPLYFVCGHVLKSVLGTLAFIQLFRSLQSTGFWEWEQADVAFLLVYNLITGVLTGAIAMAVEHLIATNTADNQEEFMYSVFTVVSGLSLLLSDVIGAGFATRLHVTNDDYRKLPLLYGECLLVGSIFFISVILLPKSAHLVGFHRIQQQSESESESESDDGSGVFETKNKDLVECGKSIEMF